LAGRHTYHGLPYVSGYGVLVAYSNEIFAPPMNEIPKAVFTKKGSAARMAELTTAAPKMRPKPTRRKRRTRKSSLKISLPGNTYVASGDLKDEIMRMKQQAGVRDITLMRGQASHAAGLLLALLTSTSCWSIP